MRRGREGWGALARVTFLSVALLTSLIGCTPEAPPAEPAGQTADEPATGDPAGQAAIHPSAQRMRERLAAVGDGVAGDEAAAVGEGVAAGQGARGADGEELEVLRPTPLPLPFDLQVEEVTLAAGVPALHSFAAAVVGSGEHQGKWLMLGGRTNGIHNLFGDAFPTLERNGLIWVVDPAGGPACSVPLDGLLVDLADTLAASNHQAVQAGDVLWIDGGYGWSTNAQDDVTFGYLIAVDVPGLTAAALQRCDQAVPGIDRHFSYGWLRDGGGADCRLFGPKTADGPACDLTITGGGMARVGEELFLALGQRFGGRYNDFFNQQQIYACQVVRFTLPTPIWGGTFDVGPVTRVAAGGAECPPGGLKPNTDPFHRRDLNVVPAVYRDGGGRPVTGLVAYGGVFKDDFFTFSEPLWVTAGGATVDRASRQKVGQYEAASLSFYSASSDTHHAVILGGISSHCCTAGESGVATPQCTEVRSILSIPGFIEDGTVLSCQGGHEEGGSFACASWREAFLYQPFKVANPDLPTGMLGSNAVFLPAVGVPVYDNGVIRLDDLPRGERTRVGTIFGGIEVFGKVPGQPFLHDESKSKTRASSRAFAVMVQPR